MPTRLVMCPQVKARPRVAAIHFRVAAQSALSFNPRFRWPGAAPAELALPL